MHTLGHRGGVVVNYIKGVLHHCGDENEHHADFDSTEDPYDSWCDIENDVQYGVEDCTTFAIDEALA